MLGTHAYANSTFPVEIYGIDGNLPLKREEAPVYQPYIAVDGVHKRRERASSNPVSRGGNGIGGLDQEPNPFEQSFSGPRHSSTGPADVPDPNSDSFTRRARSTSPALTHRTDSSSSIPKLPPLSLIASPGGPVDISGFGWGIDSLRSGPLSPALLNGPAPHHPGLYDPLLRRSTLTPLSGTSAFPPPSPATAALFALMTNNTPGSGELGINGVMTRPNEGINEGNHFDASFARATDVPTLSTSRRGSINQGLDHLRSVSGGERYMQQNIPRNNSGGRNPSQLGSQPPQNMPYQLGRNVMMPAQQQQVLPNGLRNPSLPLDRNGYGQQQVMNGHNPLYLLSQANDNNEETEAAAAALGNLSGPSGFSPLPLDMNYSNAQEMNGNLPGSIGSAGQTSTLPKNASSPPPPLAAPVPSATKGRKAATNKRKKKEDDEEKVVKKPAAKKGKKAKAAVEKDYEMDDFEDGEDGSMSPPAAHNPNETEEEKRKNFLERNRQAALKCRQRKKAWLANLQSKVEYLTADNDTLHSTVTNLKDEISSLRAILSAHANCPIGVDSNRPVTGGGGMVGQQAGFHQRPFQ